MTSDNSNPATAVAYARFSSDNQREESITAQLRAVRDYAGRNDIRIVAEYVDRALSATTDDRPEFLRMINDIAMGGVHADLVLVHKLDRFARDRYDSAVYRRELRQHGARLIAVDQPLDGSPESVILESLLEGMAEYYSKNLSREIRKGMHENALAGKHRGGPPALGYRVTGDGRYEIIEAEAVIVRRIFDAVAGGHTYDQIVTDLASSGCRTRRGRAFGKNSINDILNNPKYAGIYVAGRYSSDGERTTLVGAVPAIVDADTWSRVQAILSSRKHIYPRPKNGARMFILTGRVFCGLCGSAMTGTSRLGGRSGKSRYTAYQCVKRKQTKECNNKDISKIVLEDYVLDQIERLFTPRRRRAQADKILALHRQQSATGAGDASRIRSELAGLTQRMDRLFEAIESGSMDHSVAGPRLTQLTQERRRLESVLVEITTRGQVELDRETILRYLQECADTLADRGDDLACRRMVESYVERIEVGLEGIQVDLRMGMKRPPRSTSKADESNVVDLKVSVRQARPGPQRRRPNPPG